VERATFSLPREARRPERARHSPPRESRRLERAFRSGENLTRSGRRASRKGPRATRSGPRAFRSGNWACSDSPPARRPPPPASVEGARLFSEGLPSCAKGSSRSKCAFLRPAQRVGRPQPRAEAEGRCPGKKKRLHRCGLKGRENPIWQDSSRGLSAPSRKPPSRSSANTSTAAWPSRKCASP
jgi:hypothetical protein